MSMTSASTFQEQVPQRTGNDRQIGKDTQKDCRTVPSNEPLRIPARASSQASS